MIAYLWKILAIAAAVAAVIFAWNSYIGHKIDQGKAIGRAEVQAKWDKQDKIDKQAELDAVNAARARESLHAVRQAAIDNKFYEETQNEIHTRDTAIAALRLDARRMRTVTGPAEKPVAKDEPGTAATPGIDYGTCTVRLPAAIGQGFRELRESSIRTTSRANEVADKLRACQALLVQDRITCNGAAE